MAKRQTPRSNRSKPQKLKTTARNASVSTERIVMNQPLEVDPRQIEDLLKISMEESVQEVSVSNGAKDENRTSDLKNVYEMTFEELKSRLELPSKHIEFKCNKDTTPLSDEEAERRWKKIMIPPDKTNQFYKFFSHHEAASVLEIHITKIDEWIQSKKLIGMKNAKNQWLIPKEQIRSGKIAPGLEQIASMFSGPETTWNFLVTTHVIDDDRIRPLDLLFNGRIALAVQLGGSFGKDYL